jgi:hypothetical protein
MVACLKYELQYPAQVPSLYLVEERTMEYMHEMHHGLFHDQQGFVK